MRNLEGPEADGGLPGHRVAAVVMVSEPSVPPHSVAFPLQGDGQGFLSVLRFCCRNWIQMLVPLPHEIFAVPSDNPRGLVAILVLLEANLRVVPGLTNVYTRFPGPIVRVPLPELPLSQYGIVKPNHVEVSEPTPVRAGLDRPWPPTQKTCQACNHSFVPLARLCTKRSRPPRLIGAGEAHPEVKNSPGRRKSMVGYPVSTTKPIPGADHASSIKNSLSRGVVLKAVPLSLMRGRAAVWRAERAGCS